jgi:hypothetical protein
MRVNEVGRDGQGIGDEWYAGCDKEFLLVWFE